MHRKRKSKSVQTFDPSFDILLDGSPDPSIGYDARTAAGVLESLTGSRTNAFITAEQIRQVQKQLTLKTRHALDNDLHVLIFDDVQQTLGGAGSELTVILDAKGQSRHFAYVSEHLTGR
jgi:hypothetical protein